MPTEFRFRTGQDPDLRQERLKGLVPAPGEETALGQVLFSTAAHPSQGVNYSFLVSYRRVERWIE